MLYQFRVSVEGTKRPVQINTTTGPDDTVPSQCDIISLHSSSEEAVAELADQFSDAAAAIYSLLETLAQQEQEVEQNTDNDHTPAPADH